VAVAAVVGVAFGVRRLARSPGAALAVGGWVLSVVNVVRRRSPDTGVEALGELVTQLRAVRPRSRDWVVASVFAAANWAFDAACLAASAAALGVRGLSLGLVLLAFTAGMAASSLSLLPAGLGVVDGALVLTLVGGGIPATSALPAVLLYRLISLVGVVAVGWAIAAVQGTAGSPTGAGQASSMTRRCSSVVSRWISRVSSVLVFSSVSCSTKSWLALACWKAAARFCPIITNVDRKIASSETTSVSVGQGLFSTNSIHTAKTAMCT
jgi:hypothetical protein